MSTRLAKAIIEEIHQAEMSCQPLDWDSMRTQVNNAHLILNSLWSVGGPGTVFCAVFMIHGFSACSFAFCAIITEDPIENVAFVVTCWFGFGFFNCLALLKLYSVANISSLASSEGSPNSGLDFALRSEWSPEKLPRSIHVAATQYASRNFAEIVYVKCDALNELEKYSGKYRPEHHSTRDGHKTFRCGANGCRISFAPARNRWELTAGATNEIAFACTKSHELQSGTWEQVGGQGSLTVHVQAGSKPEERQAYSRFMEYFESPHEPMVVNLAGIGMTKGHLLPLFLKCAVGLPAAWAALMTHWHRISNQ